MDFETRVKKDIVDKYIKHSAKFKGGMENKYIPPIYIINKTRGLLKIKYIKEAGTAFSSTLHVYVEDSDGFFRLKKEDLHARVKTKHELERDYPELLI